MFVYCVHSAAVLNAAFCMTCSLLMLVKDVKGPYGPKRHSLQAVELSQRLQTAVQIVLFILRSKLLLYSAVYGVNRVQVVLSGFSVILLLLSRQSFI